MEPPNTPDPGSPPGGDGLPTQTFSPTLMRGLLAAGAGAAGDARELHGWQPPSVEELQRALPQYEITAFLARGGMGAVYKGVQRSLEREVAIKILPPDIVDDGEANYAQRFKQEARAMAKFKHPGIVTVHEAGEVELGRLGDGETGRGEAVGDDVRSPRVQGPTLLYFVMEFIEGTDVAQLVAANGQLPPEQAIRITTQVCGALAYAHSRGVVHRDIKPSNIMIDADGQVKVADFGLAKMTAHDSGGLTKSSVAMGTPDFIAPEAMIAGTLVDQRADIYAVGVMLYQMLTGHIPRGRFSPISAVVPKSDPKLDAIVDKAMQTNREKRYSSATELKRDMEKVVQRFSSERSAGTMHQDASKRRGLKPVTTLAVAALIVLGATAFFLNRHGTGGGAAAPVTGASPHTAIVKPTSTVSIPGLPDLPPLTIPPGEPGLVKEITLPSYPFLHRIALLPDSRRLLTFRMGKTELLDLETEMPVWTVDAGGDCESTAVSRDGTRFAHFRFGSQTGINRGMAEGQTAVITLRSTKDGSVIQGWTVAVTSLSVAGGAVAMSPSGKRLVSRVGGQAGTQLVALEEGHSEPTARWSVPEHDSQVVCCVDEDHYLSVGEPPVMLLTLSASEKAEALAEVDAKLQGAISADGHLLVACDRNSGMAIWDVASRQRLFFLKDAPTQADAVAFSATGLIVMAGDVQLRERFKTNPKAYRSPFGVWDSRTGARVASFDSPTPDQTYTSSSCPAAAANGTFAVIRVRHDPVPASGETNTIQIWRLPKLPSDAKH